MSLKAKIEAVIYASEEPVTLAQLVGLLGQEAQRELDRIAEQQRALALEGENLQPGMAFPEGAVYESPETSPALEIAPTAEPESRTEPAEPTPIDSTLEKRQAREKERRLRDYFRQILDRLIADYATESNDRGIEVREVAGGYRMATKPEYHDAVRGFIRSLKPPLKLSMQALETLAVVAYKQPVTAPEITEIRGVDSGGVLGSLMTRKLITTAGRKQVIGRPILYKTTKDFLIRFGLKDLNDLPSIEEFEKMAGELADVDPSFDPATEPKAQEETAMDAPKIAEANEEEERESVEAPSDLSHETELPVDGRISGPPPSYEDDSPSAEEAQIQSDAETTRS